MAVDTPRVTHTSDWCGQGRRRIILMDRQPPRDMHGSMEMPTDTQSHKYSERHAQEEKAHAWISLSLTHTHTHTHTHGHRRTARATPGTDTHRQNGLIKPESQDDADNWPVIFQ